jgi:hypothetical protein
MLKRLLILSCAAFYAVTGIAQTTQEKVEDFLGSQRYSESRASNLGLISFLEVKAEEGYKVSEAISQKKDSYIQTNSVFYKKEEISMESFIKALESDSFNILNYSFPNQDSDRTYHYLLGDSDILLTIYSNSFINRKVASQQ